MKMPPEERFWDAVSKDCWLWKGSLKPNGYGHFVSRGKDYNAHRLAWELTNGPIPDGLHVLHRCDVPLCVNPDHLFLGTHAENHADCKAKGRNARGERNHWAKLTEADVLKIRAEYWFGYRKGRKASNAKELAARYGVGIGSICDAASGRSWSHIK